MLDGIVARLRPADQDRIELTWDPERELRGVTNLFPVLGGLAGSVQVLLPAEVRRTPYAGLK